MKSKVIGKRLILRSASPKDAVELARQINHKKIGQWTTHIPYPYRLTDAKKFIREQANKLKKGTDQFWFITEKDSGLIIGGIGLHHISKENKKAELGYWLHPDKWGVGLTTEAVKLVVKYGFKKMKLHRIYAFCFAANIGSQRVLKKNKFVLEGKQRQSFYRFGSWQDILWYSLLKTDL